MRITSWVLGIVLGTIAGGAVMAAGVFALLPLVPLVAWAALERARPLGLAGVLIGLGAGCAGLVAFADARCRASNVTGPNYMSECVSPDLTAFYVAAMVVAAIGTVLSVIGVARRVSRAG